MFRKDLIALLQDRPMSVRDIADLMEVPISEVAQDLEHLAKSLKHGELRIVLEPARCRKCGFRFDRQRFSSPSKCPQCRGTWIRAPLISVTQR
jgi:predicted Zn-ribbon and HTH transcriptional regulator